ncbi:hypothetical protein [Trinickia dinghuensis]|uniref:Uncharacterized protein n=1 Tax=Trinickia dinghuensis TaxID=2291023 RepID=A0A3D8JW17_9BURK|nr:hypothetical protein [Trinickia dinghuensis]RDU97333.1 hypothetical protein DWV00_19070 [Trinickia dinghuensis]
MESGYTPTRVRYFGGEYLCTDDFQAEQNYHRRARELLNSGVFAPGIVEGLTVTVDSDVLLPQAKAFVSPGRAIDSDGQLIVLAEGASVGISDIESEKKYAIIIKYNDSNELHNSIGEISKRVVERPIVEWTALPLMEGEVLLASMSVRNGKITIDRGWGRQGMRQHAGAILGSIEFPLEIPAVLPLLSPSDPTLISIAARGYSVGNSPVLEITAPYISLEGDVLADGSMNVDQLAVKDLTVAEKATVDGLLYASGGLNVTDGATTNTLVVGGGALTSGSALTVHGDSALDGLVTINDALTVTKQATIDGLLFADGGLNVTSGGTTDTLVVGDGALTSGTVLTINGFSSLNGSTTITGALAASAGASITSGATSDTLVVGGGTLVSSTALTVNGATAVISDLTVGTGTTPAIATVYGDLKVIGGTISSGGSWNCSQIDKAAIGSKGAYIDSDPYCAKNNCVLMITTDNLHSIDVGANQWFVVFINVKIKNAVEAILADLNASASQASYSPASGAPSVAMLSVPVAKGNYVHIASHHVGANVDGAFFIYVYCVDFE